MLSHPRKSSWEEEEEDGGEPLEDGTHPSSCKAGQAGKRGNCRYPMNQGMLCYSEQLELIHFGLPTSPPVPSKFQSDGLQ
jgi:hypothetical protein